MMKIKIFLAVLLGVFSEGYLSAQDADHLKLESPFASFVENDFPFFTQTLDCRKLGDDWPKNNLVQRGLILKLGNGHFACFDIDLLRVALVWKQNAKGEYLAMTGMAPGSYRLPNKKASAGQKSLPLPIGKPIAANGRYPGWGEKKDTRKPLGAANDEFGRGPGMGLKWKGLHPGNDRVKLVYEVSGTPVEEIWSGTNRRFKVGPHQEKLTVHLDSKNSRDFAPSAEPQFFEFQYDPDLRKKNTGGDDANDLDDAFFQFLPKKNLSSVIRTARVKSTESNGLKIEEVGLPLPNEWKRNVRLSGFAFFKNGDAAISTFDGDVWLVTGLSGSLEEKEGKKPVQWRRFASGLHEPIGLEIVDDRIYVFSRNGIVRLRDSNDDGTADWYENFSNVVPQTAETREFANDIVAKPGGGFYLAKGGQQATTLGIANGTIVEVSPDGQRYEIICTGLRMPYIGVDPKTGMITVSDQQGHWKPSTPLRIVKKGEYYGFQPSRFKAKAVHPAPIVEPQIWIPHFVNQSGASQVWLRDAKMGPLNDSLIHIGYNRPEIFKVYFEKENGEVIQGGVAPITHQFASGLLKGKVHPVDGSLWLTGFKIWGTSAEQISGLYRVTPSGAPIWTPENVQSAERGVLLRFHQPVDPTIASSLASYSVDRWNYKRTHNYGSGHYKLDGEPGQETLRVASVKISRDKRSLFLGIPGMKLSHSLRVTYKMPTPGEPKIANAYLTVHRLRKMDLAGEGFEDNKVNLKLSPEMLSAVEKVKPTAELGKETGQKFGCIVCHAAGDHVPATVSAEGAQVAVGPAWNGLWSSKRKFTDGTELKKVDEVYLRESILDPSRKVAAGFETEKTGVGMPSYLGVLKDHEIESLVLYIKSLHKAGKQK